MKRMVLVGLCLLAMVPAAMAQNAAFPNRPIRMIVAFGAGSGVDANGRFFAEQLVGSS
jgi:tripartite-type tricarboxylate transporter receptor subunit TctC